MAVNDRSHLAQQVLNIGEDLERRIVGQVLLQKTVATVHRAVRDQAHYQIIAAHQTGRAGRAVLKKGGALTGEQQAALPHGKGVSRVSRRRLPLPAFVHKAHGHVRQPLQGTPDHGGVFFSALDKDFARLVAFHFVQNWSLTDSIVARMKSGESLYPASWIPLRFIQATLLDPRL